MISHLLFYQRVLVALGWRCLMLQWAWPRDPAVCPTPPAPPPPRPTRKREPNPCADLTDKPPWDACKPPTDAGPQAPSAPPPRLGPTRGRRRQVDTAHPGGPNPECASRGWGGWGHLRAHGPPHGSPWWQVRCRACRRDCLESLGTILPGTRASVALSGRVLACLAEGLGIRGTARVFAGAPNTGLQGLGEAAEQLHAFSCYGRHDVRGRPGQRDARFALRSAVKDGAVSTAEARAHLERAPRWGWGAMAPERNLLLAMDVGERPRAMAQRVLHHVAPVWAPAGAPRFLTDGCRESLPAWLTHSGQWAQPPRRQAQGPAPTPRWTPLPGLLAAQVVKTVRRRRLGRVRHRGVFGTLAAVQQGLAAGSSTPPSLPASTAASASLSPRSDDGSARGVRARRGCCSSVSCSRCTTIAGCPMPAYVCRCSHPNRPRAPAQPNAGSRGGPPGPLA
jgi:hypothetical protein